MRIRSLVREAMVAAIGRVVPTILSLAMIGGASATVLLTSGRTVGQEQSVLAAVDAAGIRTIVIQVPLSAELDSTVIDRLDNVEGVSWVGAFGAASDVHNARLIEGRFVPLRKLWSSDFKALRLNVPGVVDGGWASPAALSTLGLFDGSGAVATETGPETSIIGGWQPPDFLDSLAAEAVVVPQNKTKVGPVVVLLVLVDAPQHVSAVSKLTISSLGLSDPSKARLTTSQDLVKLRAAIEGRLGGFGRGIVVIVFAVTALLVASVLFGLVMLRRKDFGRRRALGASRTWIVALLATQTALTAVAGNLMSSIVSVIVIAASGDPIPSFSFVLGVGVLISCVAILASVPPAIVAAHRQPAHELRVA
jgi:putative ABC transport system permease protein